MKLQEWARRWGVPPEGMVELDQALINRVNYEIEPNNSEDSEHNIQQKIRLESCAHAMRLWRNNSGAVTTDDGRHIRFGLANDSAKLNKHIKSSDLIGVTPVIIQEYHLGRVLGVFTSIEVKRPGWEYTGNERETAQNNWLTAIKTLGGFAYFATGPEVINEITKAR